MNKFKVGQKVFSLEHGYGVIRTDMEEWGYVVVFGETEKTYNNCGRFVKADAEPTLYSLDEWEAIQKALKEVRGESVHNTSHIQKTAN